MFSASFAAMISTPMDVIKTRIQVQSATSTYQYKSGFEAFKSILREEGVRAFAKGMMARVLFITPSVTIVISTCTSYFC
jgi:hypothetical protein